MVQLRHRLVHPDVAAGHRRAHQTGVDGGVPERGDLRLREGLHQRRADVVEQQVAGEEQELHGVGVAARHR